MQIATLNTWLVLPARLLLVALPWRPVQANAQNVVVLVNDEPITSFDVAQRMRWGALTSNFGDRMKALLTGDAIKQRFRQMMMAAHPHSQDEAQTAAERIKKQLDRGRQAPGAHPKAAETSRKAVIEALIEDKLKLQAAKKLDVKISDKEVEETTRAARGQAMAPEQEGEARGILSAVRSNGINRKTIQEIVRAQLAWRDMIRRQLRAAYCLRDGGDTR